MPSPQFWAAAEKVVRLGLTLFVATSGYQAAVVSSKDTPDQSLLIWAFTAGLVVATYFLSKRAARNLVGIFRRPEDRTEER